jgi:hypothetical protein
MKRIKKPKLSDPEFIVYPFVYNGLYEQVYGERRFIWSDIYMTIQRNLYYTIIPDGVYYT